MLCRKVVPLLSEYFDDVLDADIAVQISQHLHHCFRCRKELKALSDVHGKLRSAEKIEAPEYLHHLVQHRVDAMQRDSWRKSLWNEWERRWSKIRTIEGIWYLTRAMGTVVASLFLFLITISISPYYINVNGPVSEPSVLISPYGQEVMLNVLPRLGLLPVQTVQKTVSKSNPAINDQYLMNFGQSISEEGKDDSFSVVTEVDRSGSAKIKRVLEHPVDQNLLNNFIDVISSARFRPGSENGQAVPSYLVLIFSRVSVSD
jgi:Putative zinc-finger